jgi:hypothetical protein
MHNEISPEQRRLLTALFGPLAEASYDEETETNMRVRADVGEMDRIVSVAFEDPLVVAN